VTLGKRQGADIAICKPTYPALLGMDVSKALAVELRDQALHTLRDFDGAADPLRELANYMVSRRN
jgi:geranylgeranyl diphosphate synthase type II